MGKRSLEDLRVCAKSKKRERFRDISFISKPRCSYGLHPALCSAKRWRCYCRALHVPRLSMLVEPMAGMSRKFAERCRG